MLSVTPGSWTCGPQTHRGGVHCRWPATQVDGGISPSASLWTCTVAGESAGNSVSFHLPFIHSSSYTSPPLSRVAHSLPEKGRTLMKNIYLEGTFLAGKRNLTEGIFLAGKRNFQGAS